MFPFDDVIMMMDDDQALTNAIDPFDPENPGFKKKRIKLA